MILKHFSHRNYTNIMFSSTYGLCKVFQIVEFPVLFKHCRDDTEMHLMGLSSVTALHKVRGLTRDRFKSRIIQNEAVEADIC